MPVNLLKIINIDAIFKTRDDGARTLACSWQPMTQLIVRPGNIVNDDNGNAVYVAIISLKDKQLN